jgi:hypothetical protein
MKCQTCKEEISPKFSHAISTNVCPFCGKEIMTKELQNILGELKIVFDDAKDYMTEVEGWLSSNFSFKRVKDSEVIIEKAELDKLKEQSKSREILLNPGKKIKVNRNEEDSEETETTIFSKRAGVLNHKKAVDFIKGAANPEEFSGVDDEYGDVSIDENVPPLNDNEQNEMANLFRQDNLAKVQELELQKLKRLRATANISAGNSGIRRE